MTRLLWKIPDGWAAPGPAERTLLYPGLYLRGLGVHTRYTRQPAAAELEDCDAYVLVAEDRLSPGDHDLIRSALARGRPVLVVPAGRVPREILALTDVPITLVRLSDPGPLRSAAPECGPPTVELQGCAARAAEDELLGGELGLAPHEPQSRWTDDYLLAAGETDHALEEIGPAVAMACEDLGLAALVAADSATRDAGRLPFADAAVGRAPAAGLIADARMLLCAYPNAPAFSPLPGAWVRTALFHGTPVVAASHPSVDGLAHLCVVDDWRRGVALSRSIGAPALAAAQAQVAELVRPRAVAAGWAAAIDQALERPRPRHGYRRPRPLVVVLVDLSQDIELLLPIALALKERQAVDLRIVVTDWLTAESPKTLSDLGAAKLPFELVDRSAARHGDAPALDGVSAVLTACDTTAGPHRAAHRLAARAAAAGVPSFTLQHGFENIGLTYRDAAYGEEIDFASDAIFIWGRAETLGAWVRPSTRARAAPVGSSKKTPPPAARLRISDRPWRRTVGVFENLHWNRFDDDYRARFLADLQTTAAANPDVFFAVKPHHAGRWLSKNPGALPEADNLQVLDPADPSWQPYTAPVLLASMEAVVTTPSTVAVDAARAGRPVAVAGYGLELPLYAPLPILASSEDWRRFLQEPADAFLHRNELFLDEVLLPGCANHRIAAAIEAAIRTRSAAAAASAAREPA